MLQIRDLGFEIRHEEWLRQTLSCCSLCLRCFWSLACPCRRHLKSPFHRLWLLLFLLDGYHRETLAVEDRGAANTAAILFLCVACRAPRVASEQRAFRGCSLWLCRAWSDQHRSIANQSFGRPWVWFPERCRCTGQVVQAGFKPGCTPMRSMTGVMPRVSLFNFSTVKYTFNSKLETHFG